VPALFLRELWTGRSVSFATLFRATNQWMLISGNFWNYLAMLKKTLLLMLVDRRSFVMDFKLISNWHYWCMTLTTSPLW
jgi:hypothetical protein